MSSNFARIKRRWLSDPSTYPVIGVMAAATALVVGFSYRAVTAHPDLKFDRKRRGTSVEENHAAGESFYNSAARQLPAQRRLEVLPSMNAVFRTATINGDVKPLPPPGTLKAEYAKH